MSARPVCEECGEASVVPCFLPGSSGPDAFYCPEHALSSGFCICGVFIAGSQDGERYGLCDNCHAELEEPEYEDDDYFYEPY